MEWADFQGYSPLEEPLYDIFRQPLPPPPRQEPLGVENREVEWTFEENKLFEDALAEFTISSPNFIENVASRVPWRTFDDIKKHYQDLVDDVESIESGRIPLPDYKDDYYQVENEDEDEDEEEDEKEEGGDGHEEGSSSAAAQNESKPKSSRKPHRQKSIPWTEEEHQLFLMGLNKFGKGDWKSISRYYVITKTPTQVASHAQKFYRRQMRLNPLKRRRHSIHDVKTVNSIPITMNYASGSITHFSPNITGPMAASNLLMNVPAISNFTAPAAAMDPNPMSLNTNFIGATVIDPNPVFLSSNFNGPAAIDPNPTFLSPNFNGAAVIDQSPMFLSPKFNGAAAIDPNPNFLSMPSSSSLPLPSAADFINYPNASTPAGPFADSYWLPSYGNNENQPW